MKLCECGCGEPAPIARYTDSRYGVVKGEPQRFVRGHNRRRHSLVSVDRGYRSPCRVWTGRLERDGYARTTGHRPIHVVEWEKVNGPKPPGLELDHLCRQRDCAEPTHLELVTRAENARRGAATTLDAEAVRTIRRLRGRVTQNDLAARFGVAKSTVSSIHCGRSWVAV